MRAPYSVLPAIVDAWVNFTSRPTKPVKFVAEPCAYRTENKFCETPESVVGVLVPVNAVKLPVVKAVSLSANAVVVVAAEVRL